MNTFNIRKYIPISLLIMTFRYWVIPFLCVDRSRQRVKAKMIRHIVRTISGIVWAPGESLPWIKITQHQRRHRRGRELPKKYINSTILSVGSIPKTGWVFKLAQLIQLAVLRIHSFAAVIMMWWWRAETKSSDDVSNRSSSCLKSVCKCRDIPSKLSFYGVFIAARGNVYLHPALPSEKSSTDRSGIDLSARLIKNTGNKTLQL